MNLLMCPLLGHTVFFLFLVTCDASPSYYITTSGNTIYGTNTSLAVHWFGDNYADITVTAGIMDKSRLLVNASKVFYNDLIGILTVPAIPADSSSDSYTLVVNGSAQNTLVFSEKIQLYMQKKNISMFIQTDKTMYRSGESVKIRVISVRHDLKPYKGDVDLIIRDPKDNIVQQRLKMKSDLGVVSTQFLLSNNPMLGDWYIQATSDNSVNAVYFSVAEYVTPKFYVTLDVPSFYISTKMLNLTGTVTAKYSYGKPLKGNVTISVKPSYEVEGNSEVSKTYEISGSVNFSFTHEEILNALYLGGMNVTATVTEELTGIVAKASTYVSRANSEYILNLIGQQQAFTPGLNFTAKVQVGRIDNKPLTIEERDEKVYVKITQSTGPYWISRVLITDDSTPDNSLILQYYSIKESDIINLEIPVLLSVQLIQVELEYQNTTQIFYFDKSYGTYPFIQIQTSNSSLKVGTSFNLQVNTYPKVEDVYYVVMAKGTVVSAGKNKTTFSLTPEQSWAPTAQLIVYFLNINGSFGDIVQTSEIFSILGTLKNKITLSWSKNTVGPLENVSLSVNVKESRSLVGLQVVEKSSGLLRNFTARRVDEELNLYYKGLLASITNAIIYNTYGFNIRQIEEVNPPRQVKLIFPETWIWLETNISSSLVANLQFAVPDKNTSWVATAFVISEGLGLGITDGPAEISVVKPLFITFNMPFSLTRGEQFILEIILSNSLKENLQVMVTLESSNTFEIIVPNNNTGTVAGQQNVTVASEGAATVLFPVKPKVLGNITITVKATSKAASDVLTKTIIVKAEGVKNLYSQTALFEVLTTGNLNHMISKNFSFTFPSDVVEGSEEAFVTVIGDLLGPSINGLQSLILMPYGCGEQNMINFAPNIYILLYLTATKQIKADIQERAIRFMEQGYQTELTYMRNDGSFSAFGNSDNSGSTWLTAFVYRCFLQARPFIYINPDVLNGTVEWLVQFQDINTGIFSEPGRVIHKELQGGLNGPITLTAYILTSLLEDQYYSHRYASRVLKAVQYLEGKFDQGIASNYTLSVVVYALSLANSTRAEAALTQLNARASITGTGGTKYWSSPSETANYYWQPRTTDIETAAYALLSYYQQNRIAEGIPVMKWLSEQRNYLGGYSSTQDTVMALQALSQFVSVVPSSETSLTVTVTGPFVPKVFHINTNLLVLQSQQIEAAQPLLINVTAVGRGLAIVQLNVEYNRKASARRRRNTPVSEAFKLDMTVKENSSNIQKLSVDVCMSYLGEDKESGMVILDFGFLSGFKLSPEGIPTKEPLKLVEPKDDKVYLYFDSLTNNEVCVSVPMVRFAKVAGSQDAVVSIYEYYNQRNTATRTYNSLTMKNISYCVFCGVNCTQCKSNVPLKTQTSSVTAPTFSMLWFCMVLLCYLL